MVRRLKMIRIDSTPFYDTVSTSTSKMQQNLAKNIKSEDTSKPKDPTQDILDKIEKLKKQLAEIEAKIQKLSSNPDELSKELLGALTTQSASINAQILALYQQLLSKGNVKA